MRKVGTLVGLALLALSGSALAQEGAPPPAAEPTMAPEAEPAAAPAPGDEAAAPAAEANVVAAPGAYPDEYALRPITLSGGMVQVKVPVVINLSKDLVAKPINIPLEIRYGISDTLELRLFHDTGLCLTGKEKGCEKVYNDVGLGITASLMKDNGIELAGIGELALTQISDPMLARLDLGVAFKYISAPVSVYAAPMVYIGLNKRDAGNSKQLIAVPVQVAFQAAPNAAIFLDTGIYGPTEHFGDLYTVPVGVGANILVQHGLDVGAEFMLPMVVSGISGNKAFDSRSLIVYAAWRNL
jgi:hypothetical protein